MEAQQATRQNEAGIVVGVLLFPWMTCDLLLGQQIYPYQVLLRSFFACANVD